MNQSVEKRVFPENPELLRPCIRRMESRISEKITDEDYRSPFMLCLPMDGPGQDAKSQAETGASTGE